MNFGFRGWPEPHPAFKQDFVPYSAEVLSDTPLVYYPMTEQVGTSAVDATGNGRTGTYGGDFTLAQRGPLTDPANLAVRMGGASAHIDCPDLGLLTTCSAEAWVKLVGTQPGSAAVLSAIYPSVINFVIEVGGNTLWAGHYNGGWHQTPTLALSTNTWYHIVYTNDASLLKLYVNGVLIGTTADSSVPQNSGSGWRVARRWDLGDFVNGWIGEVAIYNYALSAARVARHYAVGVAA